METMRYKRFSAGKKRRALFIPAVILLSLCFQPENLGSETLSLATYYPSPYGAYVAMLTIRQTVLAREGGAVGIGYGKTGTAKLAVCGNVGIGTTSPAALLDITGGVRFGYDDSECLAANEGTQRYNAAAKQMEFCDGNGWEFM